VPYFAAEDGGDLLGLSDVSIQVQQSLGEFFHRRSAMEDQIVAILHLGEEQAMLTALLDAKAPNVREKIETREQFYATVLARMEGYVTRVIESLGLDAKGKGKKLEGSTVTFSLRGCDKRAEVTDELLVPIKYKRVTVTLPAETWESVCDSLDLDLREQVLGEVKSPKIEVSTSLVKTDLKADVAVPGAKLAGGTYLVRK
jgi:hypothetical protein